jgi:hypothetical protein
MNSRMMYCPIAYIATKIEKAIIFQVEFKPPVKTVSLTMEVSITEVATNINKIAGINPLLNGGIASLLTLILSPLISTTI